MGAKKLPMYLTRKELKEHIVNWSDDTIYRRMKDGFPHVKDEKGNVVFPTQEVLDWMKRRLVTDNG